MFEFYTDGSSLNTGDRFGYGVAGVVVCYDKKVIFESTELIKGATNNIAELLAIFRAMYLIKRFKLPNAIIRSDSMYAINSFKGNYKIKKNRELVLGCQALYKQTDCKLEHVKGHNGDYGNERVDNIAYYRLQRVKNAK